MCGIWKQQEHGCTRSESACAAEQWRDGDSGNDLAAGRCNAGVYGESQRQRDSDVCMVGERCGRRQRGYWHDHDRGRLYRAAISAEFEHNLGERG